MELQFKRTVYKINLYGTDYEMRKPTVREIVDFQKSLKDTNTDDDKVEGLTKFFVSLGLKEDAISEMQMDHMVQLSEVLAAIDKKK